LSKIRGFLGKPQWVSLATGGYPQIQVLIPSFLHNMVISRPQPARHFRGKNFRPVARHSPDFWRHFSQTFPGRPIDRAESYQFDDNLPLGSGAEFKRISTAPRAAFNHLGGQEIIVAHSCKTARNFGGSIFAGGAWGRILPKSSEVPGRF
jgi:hypothetical protein